MPDFVIIAAVTAMLATPTAAPDASASAPVSTPRSTPTVGFRTYRDAASCEQAAAALVAPAGARLVCVPVEPMAGEMTSAH